MNKKVFVGGGCKSSRKPVTEIRPLDNFMTPEQAHAEMLQREYQAWYASLSPREREEIADRREKQQKKN